VSLASDYYGAFLQRLSEFGYVEGENLIIEWRFADGDYERLPGMAAELVQSKVGVRDFVVDGGLISYGGDFVGGWRVAAKYVDKILWGAKPADLPVEQPTTFELAINLTTAKALGLTIPHSVLLRATEVIQ
jgi:hypothetical protein